MQLARTGAGNYRGTLGHLLARLSSCQAGFVLAQKCGGGCSSAHCSRGLLPTGSHEGTSGHPQQAGVPAQSAKKIPNPTW